MNIFNKVLLALNVVAFCWMADVWQQCRAVAFHTNQKLEVLRATQYLRLIKENSNISTNDPVTDRLQRDNFYIGTKRFAEFPEEVRALALEGLRNER